MDPDRSQPCASIAGDAACDPREIDTDLDTDGTYTLSPGRNLESQYSCTDTSSEDDCVGNLTTSDDDSSVFSMDFEPCTPLYMPMMECRSRNFLRRSCVDTL
jgi:hypothetical protein